MGWMTKWDVTDFGTYLEINEDDLHEQNMGVPLNPRTVEVEYQTDLWDLKPECRYKKVG